MKPVIVTIGFDLAADYIERLRSGFPQVLFQQSRSKAELFALVASSDVLFGWPDDRVIAAAHKLRWLHLLGAGADGFNLEPVSQRGIMVTNSKGVAAPNIAEHVLSMMLSFGRALPALARAQREQAWTKGHTLRVFELHGQTLGIVGLGAIGKALAAKALALGMQVHGASRGGAPVPGVQHVWKVDELPKLAAGVDHLVVCLPGTPETEGLIDARVFAAMRPGSYFYNVGRGTTVVEADLLQALEQGTLAGAGLDVVDQEPLPAGHPLWAHPAIIMTSHTAGNTSRYWERGIALFEQNLKLYCEGKPFVNMVDVRRGY